MAACALTLLWGAYEACIGLGGMIQFAAIRHSQALYPTQGSGVDTIRIASQGVFSVILAVIYLLVSGNLFRSAIEWKASSPPAFPFFTPPALTLIGCLFIVSAAAGFCDNVSAEVDGILRMQASGYGGDMGLLSVASIVNITLKVIPPVAGVVIGTLIVRETRRQLRSRL
jgi:hypothetical protein